MKKYEVLDKLNQKEITVDEAYKLLYKKQYKVRRAHFIKLRFDIKDEKAANVLLKTLFFLPVPMLFVRLILKLVMKKSQGKMGLENIPLTHDQILDLVTHKGLLVDVQAQDDANILIKTI